MQDVCAQSWWDHYVYFYLQIPKSLASSVPDPQEPLLQAFVLRCVQAPEWVPESFWDSVGGEETSNNQIIV